MTKNDKSGGYWRGDKWIAITWGKKIGSGLRKMGTVGLICRRCGKEYQTPKNKRNQRKWCSWECQYANNYTEISDPLLKKTKILGANLLMGKGKQDWVYATLTSAIGRQCPYCSKQLTIDNLTIDHIEAYRSSADRRNKAENKKVRLWMDRKENLQVICRRCNQLKGTMSGSQFSALGEFLSRDQDLKGIIELRLMRSVAPFKRSSFAKEG